MSSIVWNNDNITINTDTGFLYVIDNDNEFYGLRRSTNLININNLYKIRFNSINPKYFIVFYERDNFIKSEGWLSDPNFYIKDEDRSLNIRILINTSQTKIEDVELIYKSTDIYGSGEQKLNWTIGKGINTDTGKVVDYKERDLSQYINITDNMVINFGTTENGNFIITYFKRDGTFIQSTYNWTSTTNNKKYRINKYKPEDASFMRIMINNTTISNENITIHIESLKESITSGRSKKEIIVDSSGDGDYKTIEDALNNANDSVNNHVIIRIRPGEYYPLPKTSEEEKPYKENNRYLSIIGDDKNSCIIKGDIGYYYYQIGVDCSLLRLNGDVTISNLTFISTSSQYEEVATEKGWDLSGQHNRAYCLHRDGDNPKNTKFEINNCNFYNDHFTCIGFGLKPETDLIISNCYIISEVNEEKNDQSGFSNYGTVYGHLQSGSTTPDQRLTIKQCEIINTNYDAGINLMDGANEGAEGEVSLIRNIVINNTNNNFFVLTSKIKKSNLCFGNNIESMNN